MICELYHNKAIKKKHTHTRAPSCKNQQLLGQNCVLLEQKECRVWAQGEIWGWDTYSGATGLRLCPLRATHVSSWSSGCSTDWHIPVGFWASCFQPLHPERRMGHLSYRSTGHHKPGQTAGLSSSMRRWSESARAVPIRRRPRPKCTRKPWSRWPVATCCPTSKFTFPSVQGNNAGQADATDQLIRGIVWRKELSLKEVLAEDITIWSSWCYTRIF